MTTDYRMPDERKHVDSYATYGVQPPVAEAAHCSATLPDWHRLSIRYDGTEIMGVTVACKRPENHEQMTALIRELLAVMEAPTVPDPEVLGDKSLK